MNNSKNALAALQEKYLDHVPAVHMLSDEQKAWLEMKIQTVTEGLIQPRMIAELKKINNRLAHATRDIPDSELQKIVTFVFRNMEEINTLINQDQAYE